MFIEYIVSDDDSTMRKYLTHPDKKPAGRKNIGGCLPKEIPVSEWYADPTHRAKCVAGAFFKLVKSIKKMKKLDALRLKKYYSYYIKMNRKKSVEDMMKNIMAPLDHMFDDHHLCDSKWCYKKRAEEDTMLSADEKSERMKSGYYRSKTEDLDIYNELKEKYAFYTTEEKIKQCKHEFDT